jgi:4-hydroxybenzoate polyprenyltransferase
MLRRLLVYLNEMFPASAFAGSILTAVAVQLAYLRLFDVRPGALLLLVVPGLVLTFVSLLIRVMDEFKDYQDDLTNFPERPLPSGRVRKEDLRALGFFCVFMVLFLSLTSVTLLAWALATLAFTYLMLRWFFVEPVLRRSLPLAFVSHHPIVLFNFTYLLLACTEVSPAVTLDRAWYILPVCLIFTNWEVVRKIRAPEQETAYTTYSKIFGPRPAIIIALALQATYTVAVLAIFEKLQTPMLLRGGFLALQGTLVFPSARFLVTLRLPKPLKPIAEAQILLVVAALLVGALL